MSRRLEIQVVGNTRDAQRSLNSLSKTGRGFGTALKAGGLVAGAALAGLAESWWKPRRR